MLNVAHLVVLKTLELTFDHCNIAHFCGISSGFLDVLKRVAKTLACLGGMIAVVTHAQPAELVLALTTGHMHASLILLDRSFALRARLRVDLHPV